MATLSHSESRRRYSWWWNSHISPKNSKWLQENLADMDAKVKAMIKLLEEDADSFARRAEMYYKKRPELMKLVEEFYRAYRALAEKYDSATGALRQAHRTMSEAFPNQIPLMLPDESAYDSINDDAELNSPGTPPPGHPGYAFDADGLKDRSSLLSDFQVSDRKGTYSKEAGSIASNNMGLKQSNEIFTIAEGRARKGLDFIEEEGESYPNKAIKGSRGFQMVKEKQNRSYAIKGLQQDVSRLSTENQNLKSKIMEASERVSEAENEVHTLKNTLAKINSQKDSEQHNHQLSLEKISSLESQLSNTQDSIRRLNDELVNETQKLFSAEELIQSLRLELDLLEKKAKMKDQELKAKHDELDELNVILQDKNHQCIQAEISLLSKEKLLLESQQELKLLNLEIKNEMEKLRDVELCKVKLEGEMNKLLGENNSLKEEILQHDLTIKSLQDEITSLKDERSKLEEEIEIHVREKESIKQELNLLQRDRSDLERKVKNLLDELEIATTASDTLQASIEKLESEKIELKANCNKMEAQNESLMEKLKDMDKISEENRILESSLSHGNAEIEALREKIAKLIASHESLNLEISTLVAEKDSLVSQLESITQNVENLSAKNAFLENELSSVNNEVESLKAKLKDFEASCQFLNNQNSILHTEKLTLISQVESITLNLEQGANEFAELQDKHSSLLRENDLSVSQISELQKLLKLAKQEQENLIESHKVKFADLEKKISFLQKENLLKEKDLEVEQNNFACSMMENFVLQTSLSEVHKKNACLSLEGRKHLEGQERAETLVNQLEEERLIQLENISSLSRHNEKLKEKIHLLSTKLLANGQLNSLDQIQYEVLLDSAIAEVTKLLDSISDVECENQKMHLQISVLFTFLRQIALDVINLTTEKFSLKKELDIKVDEMLFLEKKQLELKHREEILQLEMEIVSTHLSNLQEAVQTSNNEDVKLMEEKKTLSQELYNLKQKHNELKEENIEVFLETMKLDYLCCFFKCLSAERLTELKSFSKDLASLHSVKSCLETEINRLNGELTVVKSENTQLMKSIARLMEEHTKSLLHLEFDLNTTRSFFEELDLELQNIKVQLLEKEAQLSEANNKVEITQGEKAEIQKLLQAFQLEHKEAMQAREESEKTISILSDVVAEKNNETRSLHESGETLQKEIDRLKTRENIFISELEKQTNEFDIAAGKIDALLTEIQILKANAATSEEKVQDIIVEGEIHSMVEKQILTMELNLRNNYVDILMTELDDMVAQNRALINDMETHPPKITSLWKAIACLEEEVMSITNLKPLENQNLVEDIPSVSNGHCGNQLNDDNFGMELELENLMAKIETLQNATSKTKTVLKEERLDFSSRLEAAHKEIEELKMKALLHQPEIHRSSDSISKFADDRVFSDDKMSKERYGQVIKDIPLDEASSPLPRMNIKQGSQYVEFHDQLWEDAERDGNNKTWKVSPTAVEHGMEIVEEEKSEFASSELTEKELNVDKLDMFDRTFTSQKDWDEKVPEVLTSDAVRLSGIMSNVEALKRKMESLQVQELPPSFGYDTIKAQLKQTEATVLQLIDFSSNLIRKAQEHSSSDDEDIKGRRIISEQAGRVSKKVVRLEFELQKIQYVWLKLEEECENRRVRAAQRRSRVMLRDYLYGRKDCHRKQSRFCGCMRPKTTDDN